MIIENMYISIINFRFQAFYLIQSVGCCSSIIRYTCQVLMSMQFFLASKVTRVCQLKRISSYKFRVCMSAWSCNNAQKFHRTVSSGSLFFACFWPTVYIIVYCNVHHVIEILMHFLMFYYHAHGQWFSLLESRMLDVHLLKPSFDTVEGYWELCVLKFQIVWIIKITHIHRIVPVDFSKFMLPLQEIGCRVSNNFPWAFHRAHDKGLFCR